MKHFNQSLLIWLTASHLAQRVLQKNVDFSQYLMGIGADTSGGVSGEQVLVEQLKQRVKTGTALSIFDVGANLDARSCLRDFFNFFHQAGMRSIYRIIPSGLLIPLGAYRESYEQYRTTNYLACLDQV